MNTIICEKLIIVPRVCASSIKTNKLNNEKYLWINGKKEKNMTNKKRQILIVLYILKVNHKM